MAATSPRYRRIATPISTTCYDVMRIITEDFGHWAQLGAGGVDPSEIGPVIAVLASRADNYMTETDVNVDGGSDFD